MDETKICSKCKIGKELIYFSKDKSTKSGYYSICKDCKKDYRNNPIIKENIKKQKQIYYENNKENLNIIHNQYYIKTKDSRKIKRKTATDKWIVKNPNYKKEHFQNNKEKYNEYSKEYNKKYPYYIAWRNTLKNSLKRLGQIKEGHTIDLLGYSALELKNHITSLFTDGMSWDNYGEWHIDHIKRVCEFEPNTPSNIVNALSNLQPLWATTREINGVIYLGNLNKG